MQLTSPPNDAALSNLQRVFVAPHYVVKTAVEAFEVENRLAAVCTLRARENVDLAIYAEEQIDSSDLAPRCLHAHLTSYWKRGTMPVPLPELHSTYECDDEETPDEVAARLETQSASVRLSVVIAGRGCESGERSTLTTFTADADQAMAFLSAAFPAWQAVVESSDGQKATLRVLPGFVAREGQRFRAVAEDGHSGMVTGDQHGARVDARFFTAHGPVLLEQPVELWQQVWALVLAMPQAQLVVGKLFNLSINFEVGRMTSGLTAGVSIGVYDTFGFVGPRHSGLSAQLALGYRYWVSPMRFALALEAVAGVANDGGAQMGHLGPSAEARFRFSSTATVNVSAGYDFSLSRTESPSTLSWSGASIRLGAAFELD